MFGGAAARRQSARAGVVEVARLPEIRDAGAFVAFGADRSDKLMYALDLCGLTAPPA
ncbi:hypothetical protein Asi03nite_53680 [Actinoplanes siamensis]|uniref:Uncharacterized protein n=1 Tax=Actinoplanes siamensis TaxID=1223317 RepID=A0A919NBT8_9ACTN|nr:hypothetical protein Asi03nite_53680 [Actinoplanes siamensis]